MGNKGKEDYLDTLKGTILDDDVRGYAGMTSRNLSETLYKANVLPGNIVEKKDLFTPVFMSHELVPIKKAVNTLRVLEYYLWAYDHELSKEDKLKAEKNCRTLLLLLSGVAEGTYKLDSINGRMNLRFNSSYGYTKKYSYGRLYPVAVSVSQISREFRYYLFKDLYSDVDIVNAHPSILYDYAVAKNIYVPALSELVNQRTSFYEKVSKDYSNSSNVNPKRLTLIAMNISKTDFRSKSLNNLNSDIQAVREKLYEEFYVNDSDFRSAIDFRCEDNCSKNDILTKTQSLFCFDNETKHIMSFRDFYLSNIPTELHEHTSFVPFFDGLYIYSDSISYLNVSNMTSVIKKADLGSIIEKYNKDNVIKFKQKPIEMEDTLIPQPIFDKIQSAINVVEAMDYKNILHEFKALDLSDDLIHYLENVLSSYPLKDRKEKPKKPSIKMTFDYDALTHLQEEVKNMYHKLIHRLINRDAKHY